MQTGRSPDRQVGRLFFTVCIHFEYCLQQRAQSMDATEHEELKMAEYLFSNICNRTCNSYKFSTFFSDVICTGRSLTRFCVSRDVELAFQIQRELALSVGLTHRINWCYLNLAVQYHFEVHQGQYGMVQKSLSPRSGPVHACIYKARQGNFKWFSASVCVVYFIHTRTEVHYTTTNSFSESCNVTYVKLPRLKGIRVHSFGMWRRVFWYIFEKVYILKMETARQLQTFVADFHVT